MMLKPTPEEIQQALELGINPGRMNGPQLREAIRRANTPMAPPSIADLERYQRLVSVANRLDVPIRPGDGAQGVMARIETRVQELFYQKGIQPHVKVQYSNEYRAYGDATIHIMSTTITWLDQQPRIHVRAEGHLSVNQMGADSIALFAYVIE